MIDVPLRLVPEADDPRLFLAFVPVEVDGVEVEMLLDSGAGRSQLVERPGLVVQAQVTEGGVGAFGTPRRSLGRSVVSCRLVGIDVGDVEIDIVADDVAHPSDLVGQDVLSRFRCTYRLGDGLMTLDPPPPSLTHAIDLGENRHVHLEATWDDGTVASALLDTGASVTVVDERFARLHPDLFADEGTSTGIDVTGSSREVRMATMRAPRLLGQQLGPALVAVVDLGAANRAAGRPMDVVLGWTVLSQADWYVDHAGRRGACRPRAG